MFCYPCRLFRSSAGASISRTFTSHGFRDWKHATGSIKYNMLLLHSESKSHIEAGRAWDLFKMTKTSGSVADQLGSNRREQIKKNRQYIYTIREVLLLCCSRLCKTQFYCF